MSKADYCNCCKICECKNSDASKYVHDPDCKVPVAIKVFALVAVITVVALVRSLTC